MIGEACHGHSFFSEAEGPITMKSNGKIVPLLSRVIFAKKVHENILSVTEAVDRGYSILFGPQGVTMHDSKNIVLKGIPILSGYRDAKNRLFYFNLDSPTPICKNISVSFPDPPSANSSKLSPLQLIPVVGAYDYIGEMGGR
jgi:hypothetical protein